MTYSNSYDFECTIIQSSSVLSEILEDKITFKYNQNWYTYDFISKFQLKILKVFHLPLHKKGYSIIIYENLILISWKMINNLWNPSKRVFDFYIEIMYSKLITSLHPDKY